ncbi:MAG: type IX secretion system sortase PorU [Bacteroidales bacterium]|nr:type IX secretion system sortase PorU [Bacteroidales bacterium]
MKKKSWVILSFFLLISSQYIDIQAQNIKKNISFAWKDPLRYEQSDGTTLRLLYFDGAVSTPDYETLPLYFERFETDAFYEEYRVSLSNIQSARLTEEESAMIPAGFNASDFSATVHTAVDRKKNYTTISILPIRKVGSSYEKLLSVSVSITPIPSSKKAVKTHIYATNSVLRSGNWYKISVTKTGVHKVTYADLTSLGMSFSGLASDRIALFGNGGAMLPEANGADRYDDLQELPIEMHDGGDGIFNEGDYFLFYAEGPHGWKYNAVDQRFSHTFNLYDHAAYYFINADEGIGTKRRIQVTDNSTLVPTNTASTYTHYGFYETDQWCIGEAGRGWYGDRYDVTTSYTYTLPLPTAIAGAGRLSVDVAATSASYSSFAISVNGNSLGSISVGALSSDYYALTANRNFTLTPTGGNTSVTITYSKPNSSSSGYLNYLEWQFPCHLRLESWQTSFCRPESVGTNAVTQFQVANMTSAAKVWDVTQITSVSQMAGTLSGSTFSFNAPTSELCKFIAFTDNQCYAVTPVGRVNNQDLHSSSQADMIIVAHPNFMTQAERLAEFRRTNDGLSVKIVTLQQIYNEFSSGGQDITAIRDYMKMIYEKSQGSQPHYLLLFGRPSYDYRGIEGTCQLYVPNYQSNSILNEKYLRSNDDYFGILDDNDGEGCIGMVDVAVGRFPVSTEAQAKIAVDKTIQYASRDILGNGTSYCNFGSWKNIAAFVGDDEDGTTHVTAADLAATTAENANPDINLEKIYLDAYEQVTYSSSARYPEVTKAINNRMKAGCLLFAYFGHGGKNGWAHERIIELTDISKWSNQYNQPWMVTLTCELGWYDRALVSPAELAFLNANGGAAGLITTSRVAYTYSNQAYGQNFFAQVFNREDHKPITIGEANRITKNLNDGANDSKNMIYVMGDPAMRLAIPLYNVVTDSINGIAVTDNLDTLRALSRVTVSGHIEDNSGNFLPDFNGSLYPSVYDKKTTEHTLQNDPGSNYFEFQVQKNILFKGNVTVKDGRFSFSFILPKDINYVYGNGKISYYAHSNHAEANGSFHEAIIGGMSDTPISDSKGPEIELYMNDENFVNGGTVNTAPTLLVKLKDDYGINTTGNGIGHDLVAIIDGKEQTVLNNYYEAERDSFNCGTVRYPYEKLATGSHTVKVRAWDILNNASESELEFVVVNDEGPVLDHVLNYPNPFTTNTSFFFEHNLPGTELDILITIYTISGKVVKTINTQQVTEGFRSRPIPWDGRDDFGDRLGRGTYLYRLKVRTPDGKQAEKFEKIVIL